MTSSVLRWMEANRWLGKRSPELRAALMERGQVRDLGAREIVFRTGDISDGLYGVIDGQVRLTLNFENGQSLLNYIADGGDWFGEISCLDGKPRLHDAVCAHPTRLYYLPQAALDQMLEVNEFARAMGALGAHYHRASIAFASRTISQPVSAQAAYALLGLARKRAHCPQSNILPVRQEDIANMIGVSRQTIAPVLKKLECNRVVKLGYGSITVLDFTALAELARRQNS